MAEIKASFFTECEELLEGLQDGLQHLEDGHSDAETINVVFRAVHSIKGGAGAFGLDDLVGFAHSFETVLDELRSGDIELTSDILRLLFVCCDVLSDLVRCSREHEPHNKQKTDEIVVQLEAISTQPKQSEEEVLDFQPMALSLDTMIPDGIADLDIDTELADAVTRAEPDNSLRLVQISFAPHQDLYAHGNEPLFLMLALEDLGELTVKCDDSAVPYLEDLAPENAYLKWGLELETTDDDETITSVFDFVDGICDLNVTEDLSPRPTQTGAVTQIADHHPDLPPPLVVSEGPEFTDIAEPKPDTALKTKNNTSQQTMTTRVPTKPRVTVRVDLERIDRLVNLVGELVINQSMLSQSIQEAGLPSNTPIHSGLEEFLQLTRDIQESVMSIRAQPVKSLFQRMGRIVREASSDVGKSVKLKTDGEYTEVDKTVIEKLSDPLTHMIRNAVDHGLETPEKRVQSNKPQEGVIHLSAAHRSGRVVIEIRDDGAGIDRPKVLQTAINKGLIPPDTQLSDGEIDNLLFLPGFSTATAVSNLSGRGVGMDVVRSGIQALGGRISIQSEPGHGTTISVSLPLTLAVLDGMVVNVSNETLIVPLSAIQETQTLVSEDIRPFGPTSYVIKVRDSFVPMLDLGCELGYRDPLTDYSGRVMLLIANEDGIRAALVVDSIEDQRQVVIKGLQDSYGHVPGIAAATILGDGQIALILDPVDVIKSSLHPSNQTSEQSLKGVEHG